MDRTDLVQIEDSLDYMSSQLYGIRKALETLVSIAGAPEEPSKPHLKPALMDTEKAVSRVKPAMIENGDGKPLLMGMGLHALHVSRRAQKLPLEGGMPERRRRDPQVGIVPVLHARRGHRRAPGNQSGHAQAGPEAGGRLKWRTAQRSWTSSTRYACWRWERCRR